MECFMCGTMVDGEAFCPHCGANIDTYRGILYASNSLYNDGLERAKIRDLSGAIDSLKRSLKYNKYHTSARNLLGLVYFEIGEIVLALREWVLSKNLQPDNPMADRYLAEIQNTPGMLEKMNQTIKKYNQALKYCHEGSRDMATIQLRKVLGLNPKFVAGHQLLALLYMQDHKYGEARKSLQSANRIDEKNVTTLRYAREVRERIKEQNKNKKKKKKEDIIAFQDGNETIMMPQNSFRDMLDNTWNSIINILIGIGIGLLVCFFLIVPTVRQNAKREAASTLVDANRELNSSTSSVASLEKQVESLKEELKKYTEKGDSVTSYEKLMEAKEAYDRRDYEAAASAIDVVNADILDLRGKAVYDEISGAVNEQRLRVGYDTATRSYWAKDYAAAIPYFEYVLGIDESYRDGSALFYMAESCRLTGDVEKAATYYTKVTELFPNSNWARQSAKYLQQPAAPGDAGGAAAGTVQ